MKLYFSPGACGLASQIALRETEQKFSLEKVNLKAGDPEFLKVSPLGYIPALQLDDGEVLTEGAAILQWVSDQRPERQFLPKLGSPERYRAISWLNFIATELHKNLGVFFAAPLDAAARDFFVGKLQQRFQHVDKALKKQQFLMGDSFTAVDAYLYNILRWPPLVKIDMSPYENIAAFMGRVAERPSVRAAIQAEGLKA